MIGRVRARSRRSRTDLFADHEFRPYVCVSDDSHPFADEETLYAAITSTERPAAIPLSAADFASGGLPRRSYVNPWTIVPIRHADLDGEEGRLREETVERIARAAAGYLGVG